MPTISRLVERAIIISLALQAEGLPDITEYLVKRAQGKLKEKSNPYLGHYARKKMQELDTPHGHFNKPSVLSLLEGPPILKDNYALFRFRPDKDISLNYDINDTEFAHHILTMAKDSEVVVIDLWNITYLYETILGGLFALHRRLEKSDKYLALINMRNAGVAEKFSISRLDSIFIIRNSLEEALNHIESRKIRK